MTRVTRWIDCPSCKRRIGLRPDGELWRFPPHLMKITPKDRKCPQSAELLTGPETAALGAVLS